MKIYLKTFGCQANQGDSEQLAYLLKEKGHELVNSIEQADKVIINTCSVKLKTQNKELSLISSIPKEKQLFIGGCLTKTIDLRKYSSNITALFDTNSILKVPEIMNNPKDTFSDKHENRINIQRIRKNKDTAIISIQQGCLNHCSFCATKLARGNLTSYRIGDIKREVEIAIKEGCNKIYLTGQDTGCYGFDIKTNLPELLDELTTIKGNYKIRVGMMNPWHVIKILPDLINSYKSDKIQKFIHIPVQSGSERILKHMLRVHTVETFKTIVNEFRKNFPDIDIATDVIVGYPLEDENDFQFTYSLIEEIKPEVLNISMFSSRKGTKASLLKQLPTELVRKRSTLMFNLYKNYRKKEIELSL